MAKVFGSIVEQYISAWIEANGKQAIEQAGFRSKHSTIDHLVTARILMEKTQLKGKNFVLLFCGSQESF